MKHLAPVLLLALAGVAPPQELPPDVEGLIEPYVVVDVSAAVDGLLEAIDVERGDLVEKGGVVARLESSVEELTVELAVLRAHAESRIQAAQARVALNATALRRVQKLRDENIVSQDELDQARANHDLALAELQSAKEDKAEAEVDLRRSRALLELRTIRSPIEGIVVERYLSPGELVNRTSQVEVVRVAQVDPLRVEVLAPIRMLGSVHVGSKAEVRPEAPVSGTYTAEVTIVDKVVDAASGTFGIRLELPNPDNRLPAGLKCRVRFLE